MITIESVTRTYGEFTAVDDVSLTAQPGRVTGFLGPNGAGQSTTMRIIVGLKRATSGTATVAGRSYVDLPNPGLKVGVLLVEGYLDEHWSTWFDGMDLIREDDGTTTLRGLVADQAELHGLLAKARDLGTTLISVEVIGAPH